MNTRCRAHTIVSVVAALAWVAVAAMLVEPPEPGDWLRLPFFALLTVASCASGLALFPLVMRGFVKDVVLAYVAGYYHREADEEQGRPVLRAVR